MPVTSPGEMIAGLPPETQAKMAGLFDWFRGHVERLEEAYRVLMARFDRISQELEDKNRDLTAALAENEKVRNQLRSVLESMNSAAVMVDTQARILIFNAAAEKMFGIPAQTAIGAAYEELFGEMAETHLPLMRTLKQAEPASDQERYWKVGDSYKPIGYTTSVVRDPHGEILGAVEVANDLTELKRMQQRMQHAQTLAAMGEMAATVAHEIRNPLAGIGGFAGLLERDLDVDDPRRALVRKIVQGVSSLNKIVSNLLVYTRPMEVNLHRVEFTQWMDEILRYAEVEIAKDDKPIQIVRDWAFDKLVIRLDPEKFQQVFLNLIFNAIQAMPGKGVLTVHAHVDEEGWLRIAIRDTGMGIPKANLDKIFNPFFTTKEQGTGLGLAIVQRIVNLHGGTIEVRSEQGAGTEFEVRLDARGMGHG
jgi:PAS domain S-box-containing protein